MSVTVNGMEWKDLCNLVQRRLNKLRMCKTGAIHTDINSQREALGKEPKFTKDERKDIEMSLETKIKKAMTPTVAMVRKYSSDPYRLGDHLRDKALKVTRDAFIHPQLSQWRKDRELLNQQQVAREAQLDGDFQDVEDSFVLQVIDIVEFRKKEEELEAMEW